MAIDLTVTVRDILVGGGAVAVLVWDRSRRLQVPLMGEEPDRVQSMGAARTTASVVFHQIPAGRYAVAAFQMALETVAGQTWLYDLPVAQVGTTGVVSALGPAGAACAVSVATSREITIALQPVPEQRGARH